MVYPLTRRFARNSLESSKSSPPQDDKWQFLDGTFGPISSSCFPKTIRPSAIPGIWWFDERANCITRHERDDYATTRVTAMRFAQVALPGFSPRSPRLPHSPDQANHNRGITVYCARISPRSTVYPRISFSLSLIAGDRWRFASLKREDYFKSLCLKCNS